MAVPRKIKTNRFGPVGVIRFGRRRVGDVATMRQVPTREAGLAIRAEGSNRETRDGQYGEHNTISVAKHAANELFRHVPYGLPEDPIRDSHATHVYASWPLSCPRLFSTFAPPNRPYARRRRSRTEQSVSTKLPHRFVACPCPLFHNCVTILNRTLWTDFAPSALLREGYRRPFRPRTQISLYRGGAGPRL